MKLHTLPPITQNKKKRLGRGYGSGKGGHTVGRGQKGQKSRTGKGIPLWFEGGQLPFVKKLPYLRGKSRFSSLKKKVQVMTLSQLEAFDERKITKNLLLKHKIIRSVKTLVKVTGVGKIQSTVMLEGIECTKTAKSAIEKAGGKVS